MLILKTIICGRYLGENCHRDKPQSRHHTLCLRRSYVDGPVVLPTVVVVRVSKSRDTSEGRSRERRGVQGTAERTARGPVSEARVEVMKKTKKEILFIDLLLYKKTTQ